MKRICCEICLHSWIVDDSEIEYLQVCPFCKETIRGVVNVRYDKLDGVIGYALSHHYKVISQSKKSFFAVLLDLAPNLKKDIYILDKNTNDDSFKLIVKAFNSKNDELENILKKLYYIYVEEEALSEVWAKKLCDSLRRAFLNNSFNNTFLCNVKIADYCDYSTEKPIDNCNSQKESASEEGEIGVNDDAQNRGINDSGLSLVEIAMMNMKKGNFKKAMDYYLIAADNGDSEAQYQIGKIYQEGKCVENNDKIAFEYFFKSAEHNYIPAIAALSGCYRYGLGCERDLRKALQYCERAAELGDATSQYLMGNIYEKGEEVERNLWIAHEWYSKAACQNYLDASEKARICGRNSIFIR